MQVTEKGGAPILSNIKTDIGLYFFFLNMIFFKGSEKENSLAPAGRKKKEMMINSFLETEEVDTQ